MGELARRREAKLDKLTARELSTKRREARLRQADVEARENLAAYEVQLRLANGHDLAAQAKQGATSLHIETLRAARLGPDLAATQREIDITYTLSAAELIHGYMNRRRQAE